MPTRRRPGWPRVCVADPRACDAKSVPDGEPGARWRLRDELGPAGDAGGNRQRTAADRAPGASLVADRRRVEEPADGTDRSGRVPAEPAGDVRLRRRAPQRRHAEVQVRHRQGRIPRQVRRAQRRGVRRGRGEPPALGPRVPHRRAVSRSHHLPRLLGRSLDETRSRRGTARVSDGGRRAQVPRRAKSRPGTNRAGRGRSST